MAAIARRRRGGAADHSRTSWQSLCHCEHLLLAGFLQGGELVLDRLHKTYLGCTRSRQFSDIGFRIAN